jgi:hypothetical protein
LLHFLFSPTKGNKIDAEGGIKLAEALKSNSSLTSLDLYGKKLICGIHIFSPNKDNLVGNEGATKLSEVLKSNSTLTHLDLSSNVLVLVASFRSHST